LTFLLPEEGGGGKERNRRKKKKEGKGEPLPVYCVRHGKKKEGKGPRERGALPSLRNPPRAGTGRKGSPHFRKRWEKRKGEPGGEKDPGPTFSEDSKLCQERGKETGKRGEQFSVLRGSGKEKAERPFPSFVPPKGKKKRPQLPPPSDREKKEKKPKKR